MSARKNEPNGLYRLIYLSRARPQTIANLDSVFPQIQHISQTRNSEVQVTGVLLACEGSFVQALEGARTTVWETYRRITRDHRHIDLFLLKFEPIEQRRFAEWTMCGDRLSAVDEIVLKTLRGRQIINPDTLSASAALTLLEAVSEARSLMQARQAGSPQAAKPG